MPGGLGMNGKNGKEQRGQSEQRDEGRHRDGCNQPSYRAFQGHFTYFSAHSPRLNCLCLLSQSTPRRAMNPECQFYASKTADRDNLFSGQRIKRHTLLSDGTRCIHGRLKRLLNRPRRKRQDVGEYSDAGEHRCSGCQPEQGPEFPCQGVGHDEAGARERELCGKDGRPISHRR